MEIEFYCLSDGCHWSGLRDELVSTDEDPDNFVYCPDCEGNEFEEVEVGDCGRL